MNKYFAVFDKNTLECLRSGRCNELDIDLQSRSESESVVIGDSPISSNSYIKDGAIFDRGSPPTDLHHWDETEKKWTVSIGDLAGDAIERRNSALSESDWTQLPDVPLPTKSAWATYRQALRDITDQPGFPESILWPEKP